MVVYDCEECGKKFNKKSNWLNHMQNKKYPCVKIMVKKADFMIIDF